MNNEILQLGNIIGLVLQSIFCAYFMLTVKEIKNKRINYILFTMLDFAFLKYVCRFNYTVNFELTLGILMCFILIKEKQKHLNNGVMNIAYRKRP